MRGPGVAPRREDARRRPAAAMLVALAWCAAATGAAARGAGLDDPVSAIWNGLPLREWGDRATRLAGRPVILDRRLDPDTTVTRDCRGEPLADVLDAVAAEAGASVEALRSWIRIAPRAVTGRAARGEQDRAAEIARLPAPARGRLAARGPWTWADGARPRDLVATAAEAAGLAVSGLDAVPHDHLPGATLPPLPLAERLDLVLAHYDLRVAWAAAPDEGEVAGTIVPLRDGPPPVAGRREPRRDAGRQPPRGTDRYTLTLEAPLDEALGALGPRLGLEPEIDRPSLAARGILPGEIVRARVTDAGRDELLDAIVKPLGLRWRIEGTRLLVDAPPP